MDNSPFRDKDAVMRIAEAIHAKAVGNYKIMEICGGQTHAILKNGLEELLPDSINLIHGPGCPVCVSDENIIAKAVELSLNEDIILCTFGDMIRVPSHKGSLSNAKSRGADIRIVYSPLDAVDIANNNRNKQVVFFAIGFETTAPIYALSITKCRKLDVRNFSIITCMYRVLSVIEYLLTDPQFSINALLAAGHVCAITGYKEYFSLAQRHKIAISATGFEPFDILLGIYDCIEMINNQRWSVMNSYKRAVNEIGNELAVNMLNEYFEIAGNVWHGIGLVENSGYKLKSKFKDFDALHRFHITDKTEILNNYECPLNDIYKGIMKPNQCKYFNAECNPSNPLGAAMVSSEGICSAYYKYTLNKNYDELSYIRK